MASEEGKHYHQGRYDVLKQLASAPVIRGQALETVTNLALDTKDILEREYGVKFTEEEA